MMNLCFIASARSIHTRRWVSAFAMRDDYDVTLISPSGPPPSQSNLEGVRVISFQPPDQEQPRVQRYLQVYRNYSHIRKYVLANDFDIVHIHQLPQPRTAPFFWRIPRLVVSTWGSDIVDFEGRPTDHLRNPARRFILKQAANITSTSRFLADVTKTFAPPGADVHVVPFGVDLDVFKPDPAAKSPPPPIRIVITKHLRPKYGIAELIRALKIVVEQYKDVDLTIVGEGKQRAELEKMVGQLGLWNIVRFLGRVPHNQIVLLLQTSHIYAMPSTNDSETFGVAAVEAQATGLPVVATQVGGVPEVVIDGQTGFLVSPGDVDALADALLRLIKDSHLRRRMGQAAREHVRQNYDWQNCVNKMAQVYKST